MSQFVFGAIDYLVFVILLAISTAIGIYFGFFAKNANTTDEYLMGSRKMKTIPIAISLCASQLSAISFMTIPSEMYLYGFNFIFGITSMIAVTPILCYIIIPVFYRNNIFNCYEYFELRFNRTTRIIVTVTFMGLLFVMLPVQNFIPSLAFSELTNVNIHVINAIICSICVFYTLFGGIKAVVWTDVIQCSVMMFSVLFIIIMGIVKVGGLSKVIELAYDGGRLTPNFTFDYKSRTTFWNISIGSTIAWTVYVGFNQGCVQRIVSLPTLGHAKRSLVIFGIGFVFAMFSNCFTGFIIYALYYDCDPIKAGFVTKPDKLLPYFVQDIVGHLKGMPGVFVTSVFSAALSTMSASMNALAGVIYMDYIKPRIKHTESRGNFIMKFIVLILGIYIILGGLIVEKFTSILQLTFTVSGITIGSVFGVFAMGMLFPRAHGKAASWSVISSLVVMLIISVGSQGKIVHKSLPTSTEGCLAHSLTIDAPLNSSVIQQFVPRQDDRFNIFEMSFNWYALFGCFIVFLVGIPLSYLLSPGESEKFDAKLISPIVQYFVKYQLTQTEEPTVAEERTVFIK